MDEDFWYYNSPDHDHGDCTYVLYNQFLVHDCALGINFVCEIH